ncbi:MAG TPA: hypothetical protein VKB78_11035 [Pirellulales bacterium]|nr:hypothetical protein [Pirellulales bacterium]
MDGTAEEPAVVAPKASEVGAKKAVVAAVAPQPQLGAGAAIAAGAKNDVVGAAHAPVAHAEQGQAGATGICTVVITGRKVVKGTTTGRCTHVVTGASDVTGQPVHGSVVVIGRKLVTDTGLNSVRKQVCGT